MRLFLRAGNAVIDKCITLSALLLRLLLRDEGWYVLLEEWKPRMWCLMLLAEHAVCERLV